ncbi:MAG: hypothetical protein JWN62_1185, partial [Acidimicrobiales bacterium]|nr:hypothetical protein [Acidimicrobiales bacterium]
MTRSRGGVTPIGYNGCMPTSASVRALGEFAASRHGTFTLSQAAAHGISRNDLVRMERDGVVQRIQPSIWRFTASPATWRQLTYAATLSAHVVASCFSAAALHGLDGLSMPPERPEILGHHASRIRTDRAVVRRTRSLPRADVTTVDGIPCTTLARTACDLAALVDESTLVRIIDDIQRRGASMDWLMQRATRLRVTGRSGPPEVLDIVRRRVGGYRVPDSWFERLLGRCLRSPMLEGIVRQHVLQTPEGEFVARFDLAVSWARLGIEGHSRSFHLGELIERYDEDRDIRAAQQGWEIAYLGFAATKSP